MTIFVSCLNWGWLKKCSMKHISVEFWKSETVFFSLFKLTKQKIHWIWWLICQNNSLSQWKIFPVCEHEKLFRITQTHTHVPSSWHSGDEIHNEINLLLLFLLCIHFIFEWIKKPSFGIPTMTINAWENYGWKERTAR